MGPFIAAWLVGEGIIIYRSVRRRHIPPGPGELMYSSALFLMLALLAESDKARPLAVTLAWGFDIAAFMNLYPPVTGPSAGEKGAPAQVKGWPPSLIPPTQVLPGAVSSGGGPV